MDSNTTLADPFELHNYPMAQNSVITKIKSYCMILGRILGCVVCLGVLGFLNLYFILM